MIRTHRVKANVRWTLMVVIGSYTGFILMGNSIVIFYIYEYFKYYIDNDLAYTTGAKVKDTWDDNACKSKFMVSTTHLVPYSS